MLLLSCSASAKTVLSSNTILRRYVATDADAILRYSLPLPSERLSPEAVPPPIRRAQELLERLAVDVRARGAAGLIVGRRDLAKLTHLLTSERLDILLDVPAKKRTAAAELLAELERKVADIESELGLPPANVAASLFPRQIVAVTETIQDVVESRNAMSRRTNFDGKLRMTLRPSACGCRQMYVEKLLTSSLSIVVRFCDSPRDALQQRTWTLSEEKLLIVLRI